MRLANLVEGEELGGEITGVRPFGAFVDVGAEEDGLLKARSINNGLVKDLNKVLRKGSGSLPRACDVGADCRR